MNTFGTKFRLTTYGESHGLAVGGIIDGCPSQVRLDMEAIRTDLARRRQGALRQEEDEIEWLSGLKYPSVSLAADSSPKTGEQPVTLGTPIAFTIRNKNTRSEDYDPLADCYRPGHADYTYQQKYGLRDHRGGGRASARETVARVVAGAIAKQLIAPVEIHAEVDVSNSSPDLGEEQRWNPFCNNEIDWLPLNSSPKLGEPHHRPTGRHRGSRLQQTQRPTGLRHDVHPVGHRLRDGYRLRRRLDERQRIYRPVE